jgi:hypothetical protein
MPLNRLPCPDGSELLTFIWSLRTMSTPFCKATWCRADASPEDGSR